MIDEDTKKLITQEELNTYLNEFRFAIDFINEIESKLFVMSYSEYQNLDNLLHIILIKWQRK